MKQIIITLILVLSLPGYLSAKTFQIKPIQGTKISIPTEVYFVTTGPRYMNKKALRITFVVEEIYPSLYVEEITYGDTEGDPDIITRSAWLSGFDIAKAYKYQSKYGYEYLTNLEFRNWSKWNEFSIKERHSSFRITYGSDNKFSVTQIK